MLVLCLSALGSLTLGSCNSVACRQAGDDDGSLGVDNADVVKLEVTGSNTLADCKRSYVYGEVVGKILEKTADFKFAAAYLKLTTGLYACRVTADENGNLNNDGLGVVHCQEVSVESLVVYGVILNLVKECGVFLAVYVQVNNVAVRSVGKSLQSLGVYAEGYVLYAVAINHARHFALAAYLAHVSFAAGSSLGTGK